MTQPDDPDRGLDVDAAFAEIVARYGPVPEEPSPDEAKDQGDQPPPRPAPEDEVPGLLEPVARRTPEEAGFAEEHFVPPPPPPLPTVEPRRGLAWAGLLGSPLVALVLVAFGAEVSGWVAVCLAAAFVGGFGYLVATMRDRPPDDWSGDNGAVV